MSTAQLTASAFISQSVLMVAKRYFQLELYFQNSPFPVNGYTKKEFLNYYKSVEMQFPLYHLMFLLLQTLYLLKLILDL